MEQEVFNLADQQTQLAITNALNYLTKISSSRVRSSSSRRNSRKISFHNILPRCSVPATKNDLVQYQLRLLSSQIRFQNSVQYSFSLNQPWLTKVNQELSIRTFANEFVEHTIQTAVLHLRSGEDQTSCSSEMNFYIDRFLHSTIEQALENISSSQIELYSNRLIEDIIADALSIIFNREISVIDDEKYIRKVCHSSSVIRSNEKSVDSFVNNIAQQIYTNSFNQLKSIFLDDNN